MLNIDTKDNLPDPEFNFTDEIGHCYWLSFCDPEKPKGTRFLGVILTYARDPMQAIQNTWKLGINPGGEVMVLEVEGTHSYHFNLNKLLTEEMLRKLDYV